MLGDNSIIRNQFSHGQKRVAGHAKRNQFVEYLAWHRSPSVWAKGIAGKP
jgi:hypothetical protein